MKIKKKNEGGMDEIRNLETSLLSYFSPSRFTFTVDSSIGRSIILSLRTIRLKTSKPYCGNHPGPCVLGGGKKRGRNYLEGLDWVEFNDMLNSWADSLSLDADISSAICIIRVGRKRRIDYSGHNIGTNLAEWNKWGEIYEDYCGKVAPPSEYPPSTPGEYNGRDH